MKRSIYTLRTYFATYDYKEDEWAVHAAGMEENRCVYKVYKVGRKSCKEISNRKF